MAFPTAVNDQTTDSVTQANVEVLGVAPSIAMANLYSATSKALSDAAQNATLAQQLNNVAAQTASTMGVVMLYSMGPGAAAAAAVQDVASGKVAGLG